MTSNTILYDIFFIKDVEDGLAATRTELDDYAQHQGEKDGLRTTEITETELRIKILDYIQSRIQQLIDFIKQTTLVTSQVMEVREFEQEGIQYCDRTQLIIDDKDHQIKALERTQKELVPDPYKYRYGSWLLPLASFVGVADGTMAYFSYREGGYDTLQAIITSAAIALVIAGSHALYAGWIMKAKGRPQIYRIIGILFVALVFFYGISSFRADGINNAVSIAVPGSDAALHSIPPVSKWAICIVSFILFAVVLFLSLVVWCSKEERLQIQEYKKVSNEIKQKNIEIAALSQEIKEIKAKISAQRKIVRKAYDYVTRSIKTAKNIGEGVVAQYKKTFARFHSGIPAFFVHATELKYDESIHFFDIEKQNV